MQSARWWWWSVFLATSLQWVAGTVKPSEKHRLVRAAVAVGAAGTTHPEEFPEEKAALDERAKAAKRSSRKSWEAEQAKIAKQAAEHERDLQVIEMYEKAKRWGPSASENGVRHDDDLINPMHVDDATPPGAMAALPGPPTGVLAGTFSPNNLDVASTSSDGSSITIWNSATGAAKATLYLHSDKVETLQYSVDGDMLMSGGLDNLTIIWDPAKAVVRRIYTEARQVKSVSLDRTGVFIMTGEADSKIRIWDTRNERLSCIMHATAPVEAVAFNPNALVGMAGLTAASGGDDFMGHAWEVGRCIKSPDKKLGYGVLEKHYGELMGHTAPITSIAFSPGGKLVVTGSMDCTLRLYEWGSWNFIRYFAEQTGPVQSVAFAPHNVHEPQMLAAGSRDGKAVIYVLQSGRVVTTIDHSQGKRRDDQDFSYAVNAVSYSPDGKKLMTAGADHAVKIWTLENLDAYDLQSLNEAYMLIKMDADSIPVRTPSLLSVSHGSKSFDIPGGHPTEPPTSRTRGHMNFAHLQSNLK